VSDERERAQPTRPVARLGATAEDRDREQHLEDPRTEALDFRERLYAKD